MVGRAGGFFKVFKRRFTQKGWNFPLFSAEIFIANCVPILFNVVMPTIKFHVYLTTNQLFWDSFVVFSHFSSSRNRISWICDFDWVLIFFISWLFKKILKSKMAGQITSFDVTDTLCLNKPETKTGVPTSPPQPPTPPHPFPAQSLYCSGGIS